jgi:AcrR family transcriptional regulator
VTATTRRRAGTDEDKAKRRGELLAAAKSTFARDGFHDTTMANVARAAHVSYGTVYWYFDSKDELFDAVVEAEGSALNAAILEAIAASGSPDHDAALVATVRAVFEHLIVEDAQSEGRIRQGPPSAIAFAFAALIGQFVQRRLRDDDAMSDAAAADFVVGILIDGLRVR